MRRIALHVIACLAILVIGCSTSKSSPTAPTAVAPAPPPPAPAPVVPTISSVTVTGTSSFTAVGQSQLTARATLSDGNTEDRTSTATWQTANAIVATVSSQGLVTVLASGDTSISATVSDVRGSMAIAVRIPNRTPDPQPGQRIALPDVRAFTQQVANARPDLLVQQSCPNGLKYQNNPWLDYMVDQLRTLDTRWGYNGKPTRSAADNGGQPVIAAGDEVAFHYGAGPDQNSPQVYLIDLLEGHCGSSPRLTYREFTGEEPGFWTGAGRLR